METPTNTPQRSLRQNSIYLLPNSFTIAALFSAFYAITQSMHGRYETAAIAVFISMLLDGMDGRVARLTNSQSAFGEQLDSLADMVSFGVAPALIAYKWQLWQFGKIGYSVALHLLRLRRPAPRPVQHTHRQGGQTLVYRRAQSDCRRADCRADLGQPQRRKIPRRPLVGIGHHTVCFYCR